MLVAIHQPHYVPWLGYLDRMARADVLIVLDHVQFERRNYQNRTMIRLEDESRWLTVPVVQLSQKETIVDKLVDNTETGSRAWGPTHFKTLKYAYRKAAHFDTYAPRLQQIMEARWDKLIDLDLAMLEFLRESFEIRTPLKRSSEMKAEGARSTLLLNLCREIGPRSTFFVYLTAKSCRMTSSIAFSSCAFCISASVFCRSASAWVARAHSFRPAPITRATGLPSKRASRPAASRSLPVAATSGAIERT